MVSGYARSVRVLKLVLQSVYVEMRILWTTCNRIVHKLLSAMAVGFRAKANLIKNAFMPTAMTHTIILPFTVSVCSFKFPNNLRSLSEDRQTDRRQELEKEKECSRRELSQTAVTFSNIQKLYSIHPIHNTNTNANSIALLVHTKPYTYNPVAKIPYTHIQ